MARKRYAWSPPHMTPTSSSLVLTDVVMPQMTGPAWLNACAGNGRPFASSLCRDMRRGAYFPRFSLSRNRLHSEAVLARGAGREIA